MENTTENKLKFFAQYFWQRVLKNVKSPQVTILNGHFFYYSVPYIENYHLELRSIDSITNDECVELFDLKYPQYKDWEIKSKLGTIEHHVLHSLKSSMNYQNESYFLIDFLRSKGFLVPFMNLTTDQILEFGWAKIKDTEQTKGE